MLRGREQISAILQQSPACVLSSHFTCMAQALLEGLSAHGLDIPGRQWAA